MDAKPLKVLLIEDNPGDARLMQEMLAEVPEAHFDLARADRLGDGLAQLSDGRYDVVLLDLTLPDSHGIDTFLQARRRAPQMPIVVLTGLNDHTLAVRAVQEGAQDYLVKGQIDADVLARSLRYAVERHARQRAEQELLAREEEVRMARLKDAFIQVASHELRTPLTILLGLSELAVRSPGLESPLKEWLHNIRKAGLRLQGLVDQMIKLLVEGRVDRGLDRRPTGVAELLHKSAGDVRAFVEQRRQQLSIELEGNLGTLNIEASKIRDALDHLLLNAVKFTPDGGTIRLRARRTGDGAEIRVSDSGVGIEEAALPRVFDPFFTTFDVMRHSSGTFEYGRRGLGLGLTIAKLFVEMHGGEIRAASTPGEGSTFTVRLPAT